MPPQVDVTVIGDALLDVAVAPAERLRPGADVPAAIAVGPGGQGANLAVRLARRGLRVGLHCAIGDDAAGRIVTDALRAEGVELAARAVAATGTVVVLLDADGERTMLSQRVPLLPLDSPALVEGGWLVVSGYVLLEPAVGISGSVSTPRRMLLGCALDPRQARGWVAAAASLSPHLVVLNLDEARVACDADGEPVALARRVGQRIGGVAVVTHAGGAAAALDREPVEVPAPAGGPSVDATGAGDAFAAGLLASLLTGDWPPAGGALERAMTTAAALAAAVARVRGAQGRVAGEGQTA